MRVRRLFLIGLICLHPLSDGASLVDAQFRLNRKLPQKKSQPRQEIHTLYKELFAKSMYSKCRWLPSDSQYMSMMSRRCGAIRGTLLSYARFATEFEAYRLSAGAVNDHGHIRFVDFGDNCDLF